jgi:predicted transcriptional regulator
LYGGMKKGRNRWEMIRDMLKAILEDNKVKKTRIMQEAYLDWRTFNTYFDYLLNEGFITKRNLNGIDRDESYALTEKGFEFLKKLKELEEVLC